MHGASAHGALVQGASAHCASVHGALHQYMVRQCMVDLSFRQPQQHLQHQQCINSDILEVVIETDLSYTKQDEMHFYSSTHSETSSNIKFTLCCSACMVLHQGSTVYCACRQIHTCQLIFDMQDLTEGNSGDCMYLVPSKDTLTGLTQKSSL